MTAPISGLLQQTSAYLAKNFFVPGPPVAINNVTAKALTYYQTNSTYPDNYLFWDIVHPTTQGHALVAGLALQAVPEPSTYAMALAGLACGGLAIWRRRPRRLNIDVISMLCARAR